MSVFPHTTPWSRILGLLSLFVPLAPLAANLQVQDLFFVGSHRFPVEVVGDDRNAFLRTEGGVLVYDYRRRAFTDNLMPGQPLQGITYSTGKSRLYMKTQAGDAFEYNPVFRRATSVREQDVQGGGEGASVNLTGLSLGSDYFFLGDAVRDKWNRRADLVGARQFEYDNLWVLTRGFGAFLGSARRKEAQPLWFGLYDAAAQSLFTDGKNIWFGGLRADGGLTSSRTDLTDWKVYPAQQEYDFPNGSIRAILPWKGFLWMATGLGVVRLEPEHKQFRHFRKLGTNDLTVFSLLVHEDELFAGTEQGVARLDNPDGQFVDLGNPGGIAVPVFDLSEKGKDLWAATKYGLFVHYKGEWKTLNDVSGEDVPEALGQEIKSVAYHDSSLYWVSDNRIMTKSRKALPRVLLERDRPFRIRFDGQYLLVGWYGGFTAWNMERGLWTDFTLADGIPGTQVLSFAKAGDFLWVGTDQGVMRIALRGYLP